MSNKVVVDSSVFISALGVSDEFSEQSRAFFKAILGKTKIVLNSLIVIEVLVQLAHQGKKELDGIMDNLYSNTVIPLDEGFVSECLKPTSQNQKLRSSDFVVAVTGKINGSTIISWDRRLLENGICEAKTPTQFLESVA